VNGKTAKLIRKLTNNAPHPERRGVKRVWASLPHEGKGWLRRRMALEVRSPGVGTMPDRPLAMVREFAERVR
jgi:hypothetical protein